MIGSLRYWASRMFAARYWPKVGATAVAPAEPRVVVVGAVDRQGIEAVSAVGIDTLTVSAVDADPWRVVAVAEV